ncbi:phage portal protein [Maritimibacter sp. DP1N21-5]|nr:phage portal protein [Maritimibacter sp. DP1N21-5]
MALATVWACTNLIAGTLASLPVEITRKGADGRREVLGDHPLSRVLREAPNADQTALEFIEHQALAIELWGNGFARKIMGATDRVIGLEPLHPGKVQVYRASDGALGYRWTDDRGKQHQAGEREIVHLRGFGGHPLGGLSTLAFARNSFGLARQIDRSAAAMFENGMQPSGALTFKEFLTAEQRQIAETRLVERHLGARNAGRPMILEGGVSWEPMMINPEDAQMLEARRFSVEEICRFFQVPPHMVGHTDKATSWGSGLEQQMLGFLTFTLRVRIKRIETGLERQLLTPADRARGIGIKFNVEGLLRSDSEARSEFYERALRNGWMTINEVRALEGLEPVTGGEVPRMQMQNVPITDTGKEAGNGQ